MANAQAYLHQIQALLPVGAAWSRDADAILTKFLSAWAEEFSRIDQNALSLLNEADPRTVSQLLADWEATAGLPDDCATGSETVAERIAALVAKVVGRGGQSSAFYINLAKALGYDITINEYRPFRCGISSCGDPLNGQDWTHYWAVEVSEEVNVRYFSCGTSTVGEPLRTWGDTLLECVFNKLKPAHTHVNFNYGG